jgi:hypothetical protein
MAFSEFSVCGLFIPFIIFIAGSYIAYKGLAWRRGTISGVATSPSPGKSPISEQEGVYWKVVVSYLSSGPDPWKQVLKAEGRAPLLIGGKPVDVPNAVFEIGNCNVYKGYVGAEFLGTFGKFRQYMARTAPVGLALEAAGEAGMRDQEFMGMNQYIDEGIVERLMRFAALMMPKEARELKKALGKPLRICECIVPQGATLHISGLDPHAGSKGEVVVSDADAQSAELSLREKSIGRTAIGFVLIALSLIASVLILLS